MSDSNRPPAPGLRLVHSAPAAPDTAATPAPNPEVVALLRNALAMAEAGTLEGVAVVTVHRDGTLGTAYHTDYPELCIGGLHRCIWRLLHL